MATGPVNPEDMTEEQLRAAYEQEIKRVRVEHVLLENVVTIINLGLRRSGLMPGTEDERDVGQVRLAIEVVRALLPQIEAAAPEQAEPIRQALSQLQIAFVQAGGGSAPAAAPPAGPGAGGPGAGGPGAGGPGAGGPGGGGPGVGGPGAGGAASGAPAPAGPAAGEPAPKPGEPGPAQKSGRLWVPGQ